MRQNGFGLTEVLIGLLLSSCLMLSLAQMYSACKSQYRNTQIKIAEVFDIEWVSALLRDSIMQAGFTPCLSLENLICKPKKLSTVLSIEQPPKTGITVQHMHKLFNRVIKSKSSIQLFVTNQVPIHRNQLLIIADCYHAELSFVESVRVIADTQLITLQNPLHYNYSGTAYIGEFIKEKWYLQANKNQKGALYYRDKRSEVLTPLIQTLHIAEHKAKGKHWIKIILGLNDGPEKELIVSLRNA